MHPHSRHQNVIARWPVLAVVTGGAERHFQFCVHSSLRGTFFSSVPYTDLVLLLLFLPASWGGPAGSSTCWWLGMAPVIVIMICGASLAADR